MFCCFAGEKFNLKFYDLLFSAWASALEHLFRNDMENDKLEVRSGGLLEELKRV